ncbi:hypothetical protein D8674_027440 [Pyrus ussuriensis x Pyrus communis]|uniref:RNase H type-1 domain-containing protein n=1 Tax=Pyrus ussuriensis x Pyrus communis TaxID=2448454 RepID=A0A5N5I9Q4_9ROSA|nr:hypothetical protein D8674_027440 [Pyrus ussuriensis x Pyrus communis]
MTNVLVARAMSWWHEFVAVNSRPSHTPTHLPDIPHWSAPAMVSLKMNIDGSWSSERKIGGAGFVVSSAAGDFVEADCRDSEIFLPFTSGGLGG